MAMVFENYALYPHLDVFDNIAMPLVARGRPRAEIRQRVAAVAETLQIGSMLKMRPYQLSGGQRQRVSVGRAIIRQPKMFLMDEPLGHLEAYLRLQLRAEIRRLHERLRATTVHITHDQEEAAAVSDRIAVMNKGRLQQVGTIVDLLDRARQPVRRRVHRQPADQHAAGDDRRDRRRDGARPRRNHDPIAGRPLGFPAAKDGERADHRSASGRRM